MDVDEGEVSDSDDDIPSRDPAEVEGLAEMPSSVYGMEKVQTDKCEQNGTDALTVWDKKRPAYVEAEAEHSEGEVTEDMESSRPKLYKVDLREFVNASEIIIPEGLTEETPLHDAARQIAHSIREPKIGLMMDVLATIGFERTMDVLREAKVVQETGGMETRDGSKPNSLLPSSVWLRRRQQRAAETFGGIKPWRSAGGVFLTLLKSHASSAEVKQVYAREKAIMKKRARMGEGSSKARQKNKRKRKGKQECRKPDTGQEEMEESRHRKVPDRRQLISYKDLTHPPTSDIHIAAASLEQPSMEESSADQALATVEGTLAEENKRLTTEETRLAEEFDSRDTPDGLDGLEFDWY